MKVGLLKSPTIVLLPSVMSEIALYVRYCDTECIFIYNCYMLLVNWSVYHYIMSFFAFVIVFYFMLILSKYSHYSSLLSPFAWNVFFYPFTFSICVSLNLKWVFCRHQIVGSCFFLIHSATVFWLEFNPLTINYW